MRSAVGSETAHSFHHIGLTVPDLAEAEGFFAEALGWETVFREGPYEDPKGDFMEASFAVHPRAAVSDIMMRTPDGVLVELLEYSVPGEGRGPAPTNSANSAPHLAFQVDDFDAALQTLAGREGVTVLQPHTISEGPTAGMSWVYLTTPWGLTLELVSFP